MAAPEVTFSELVNRPVDTVKKLHGARALQVRRRDGEDLVLSTASRAAEEAEVTSATTKLFVAMMQKDDRVRTLATEVLPTVFPWVRFLPKPDVQAFVVELMDVLEAAESLGNPAPVAHVIAMWKNTAGVYADPEVLAVLKKRGDDLGEVAAPDSTTA